LNTLGASYTDPSMFTKQQRVGRLIEARVFAFATLDDVDEYSRAFPAAMFAGPARPVLCADHRPVVIYSPRIADRLAELFQTMNARWERVAIVVAPTNATLGMQLQRLVRESANPSRRVFFDGEEAAAFLGEVLAPEESERVRAFLAEDFATSPSGRPGPRK
jgi:hypothetical protein